MIRWKLLVMSSILFAFLVIPCVVDAGKRLYGLHIENNTQQCVRVAWGVNSNEEYFHMVDKYKSSSYQPTEIGKEFVRVSVMVERDGEETEETYTLEVTSADKQRVLTVSEVVERGSMELR